MLVPPALAALNLYARYCHAVDSGDFVTIGRCFTEDGVLASGRADDDGRFVETSATRGRDRIVNLFKMRPPEREGYIHDTFNILIEPTGLAEAAELDASAYFRVLAANGDVECMGRYLDRLVFVDGDWRFKERKVRYTWGHLGRLTLRAGVTDVPVDEGA